jgi:hypothetical protein
MSSAPKYLNKPDGNSSVNDRILHGRIDTFFKKKTRFNVRIKQGFLGDHNSPAVFSKVFEEEFSRRDTEKAISRGWIERKMFNDPASGGHRAAFVFVGKVLPQIDRRKRFLSWIAAKFPILLIAILFILIATVALLMPFKHAHAFGQAKKSDYQGDVPSNIHKFVDSREGVLCYWFKIDHAGGLSCLWMTEMPGEEPVPEIPRLARPYLAVSASPTPVMRNR